MFKNIYKSMNSQVQPEPELVDQVLLRAKSTMPRKKIVRRLALALAVVILLTAAAVPALANVDHALLYRIAPAIAQYLTPVQQSCEDNGIRMEVVSAKISGNTASLYVTMQDLTGDRVDETTDLFDSYRIYRPFDSMATCSLEWFDADTKTVGFLIQMETMNGEAIPGGKVTFTVKKFISGKEKFMDHEVDFDLNLAKLEPETKEVELSGAGSYKEDSPYSMEGFFSKPHNVLVPAMESALPAKGLYLTGAGYVDGLLHVQNRADENFKYDNHGHFYLKDAKGNILDPVYEISFVENQDSEDRVSYSQSVFDISPEELGEYSLYGDFYSSGQYAEGDWRVTFPLENTED